MLYSHHVNRRAVEFGCAIVVIGLAAGVAGMATSLLLDAVEHLVFHYSFGSLLEGVTASSPVRRALGPMIGGALAGLGWWLLRRHAAVPELGPAITAHRRLPRVPLAIDAALQVLLVGAGASLGREGAPRQLAAVLGDAGTARWNLTARDREILLGCAAGAGLGAVYGVPIGGALFSISIMLKSWHPRVVGTALLTSSLAVAVASPVTHEAPPLHWPAAQTSYLLIAAAAVLAPVAWAVGMTFNRLMAAARPAELAASWLLIPSVAAAGLLIGICSIWFPDLPGNGESILTVSLDSSITLAGAAAVLLLKPLLTAAFLRSGAVGGMLTPSLATGAAAGALLALTVNAGTGLGVSVPAVALTCAAGVLAITQRAPLWAGIFVWELARPPWWMIVPLLLAALLAYGLQYWRRRAAAPATGAP